MYIAKYRKVDTSNGPGIRSSIFVSGCTHNCKGCFNQEAFNFKYGTEYNEEFKNKVLSNLNTLYIQGVSILGGEPFQQTNDNDLIDLLKAIKETGKSIWIYSGYTLEEILEDEKRKAILDLCDVLVDGKYNEELKDVRLQFRGSSNQRIIDIKTRNLLYI